MTDTAPAPAPGTRRGLAALIALIALNLAVGAVGGLATASSVTTWYAGLNKPAFNPPNAVFAPVWTVLYVLMAYAAWRVWRADRASGRAALALYSVQLALNLGWSLIFFGLRQPGFAFAEIVVLFVAIVATVVCFWRIDRLAGIIMVPYVAWVAFASVLNFAIMRLN
jgi:benzodiazapine receptor